MPIVRDFIYETWDETGLKGLRPTWFDNADPAAGTGVAHDILEHFSSATTVLEGESEAVGAFLLLRLANGWNYRSGAFPRSEAEILSRDVETMLEGAVNDGLPLPEAAPSRRLADEEMDRFIVEGVRKAVRGEEALRSLMVNCDVDEEEAKAVLTAQTEQGFITWLRRGYRRAVRRYAGCDTYMVGISLFARIGKVASNLIESESLWEGAKVRISVSPRRGEVNFKVYDEDECRWLDAELFC